MGWSNPKTWVVGEVVLAADLNTQLRDNLRALKGLDGAVTFSDNIIVTGALSTMQLRGYGITVVSDNLSTSADTERSTTVQSYTKLKEIQLLAAGTLRIKFDLAASIEYDPAYGRIYRNGAGVGTERSENAGNWTTFSEDIAGWAVNDLCQLYAYAAAATAANVRNFRLYGSCGIVPHATIITD